MFDLTKYICENHKLILECKEKNIPFNWSDDAVDAVYKIAKWSAGKLHVNDDMYEDFVQDCCFKFFSYIVYKYKPEMNVTISTFSYVAFRRMYRLKIKDYLNRINTLSLQSHVDSTNEESCSLEELLRDPSLTPDEELLRNERHDFLRKIINEDEILYKHFIEGKIQAEIAREYGISREAIRMKLLRKLRAARVAWNEYDVLEINKTR